MTSFPSSPRTDAAAGETLAAAGAGHGREALPRSLRGSAGTESGRSGQAFSDFLPAERGLKPAATGEPAAPAIMALPLSATPYAGLTGDAAVTAGAADRTEMEAAGAALLAWWQSLSPEMQAALAAGGPLAGNAGSAANGPGVMLSLDPETAGLNGEDLPGPMPNLSAGRWFTMTAAGDAADASATTVAPSSNPTLATPSAAITQVAATNGAAGQTKPAGVGPSATPTLTEAGETPAAGSTESGSSEASPDIPFLGVEMEFSHGGRLRVGLPVGATVANATSMAADEPAKLASLLPRIVSTGNEPGAEAKKIFLNANSEQEAKASSETGTGSANPISHMPAAAKPFSLTDAVGSLVQVGRTESALPSEPVSERIAPAEPTDFARRAVETVVKLVESRVVQQGQNLTSVSLRLKFDGEDLGVRVELRDGIVHTSFRTDSSVLRSALSQEWQGAVAEAPRSLKFQDPQFLGAGQHHAGADTGSGGRSARDQSQAQALPDEPPVRLPDRNAAAAPVPAPGSLPVAAGSLRLSAVA